MNIRTVDVTDWLDWERACVDMTTPYEVISSPYGETVVERFATEAEALEAGAVVAARMGYYTTSWGDQDINTEYTITHYVDSAPEAVDVDACMDCAQAVSGISAHERGEDYPEATLEALERYGMRLVNGDCGDDNEHCEDFSTVPCGLCGSALAGERHRVAILPEASA